MSKLKIELPASFPFTVAMPIRITDLNYGGHLGNDSVLTLVQEARLQFLATLGASEVDLGTGTGSIMANAQIVFLSEGHYGMTLNIDVAVVDISSAAFELGYRLVDRATGNEVARVLTTLVSFDYQRRRPVHLPETFRQKLQALLPA